jgi:hypothetical protein
MNDYMDFNHSRGILLSFALYSWGENAAGDVRKNLIDVQNKFRRDERVSNTENDIGSRESAVWMSSSSPLCTR